MKLTKIEKPKVIVLGGTNPHRALVENLKKRGYYAILIDYLSNPPAAAVADEHIKESTLDKEIVLEIAKERKVDLVLAICIDQANVTACYVSEKLNLPTPYGYETSLDTSDKIRMKKKMKSAGIHTSKFMVLNNDASLSNLNINFPVVVKPADTTGSKGVKKISDIHHLKDAYNNAREISRTNQVIVEEFIDGDEIQFDCFVSNGVVDVLMSSMKNKVKGINGSVLQSFGSLIPANVASDILTKIRVVAERIVDTFKFNNTPFFIQTIVSDGQINVIEFAPRIGGGLSYRIIPAYTGFDTLKAALSFYTGEEVEIKVDHRKSVFSTNNLYTDVGHFGYITGIDLLMKTKVIKEFYPYKTPGMKIGSELTSNNRVGAFIIEADSMSELKNKIIKSYTTIKIFDSSNRVLRVKNLDFIEQF